MAPALRNNFGLNSVPRDPSSLHPGHTEHLESISESLISAVTPARRASVIPIEQLRWPDTELVKDAFQWVKDRSASGPFNHSIRVYMIGAAIAQDMFPESFKWDPETYFLTSLFHDIGVADEFFLTTKLSFEYRGGIETYNYLTAKKKEGNYDVPQDLIDSVTEAILRHTNFVSGRITTHGQLIQLATLYDNIGAHQAWVHPDTYEAIVKEWPRGHWSNDFITCMSKEMAAKPWCHTTALQASSDFLGDVERNSIARKYE